MNRLLKISTIVLGFLVLGLLVLRGIQYQKEKRHSGHGIVLPEGLGTVKPFELTDQLGQPFGTKNLEGRSWLVNFIFTRCAGPCPIISAKTAQLQSAYAESKNLTFVSFSVDPDFDTPPILEAYAKNVGAKNKYWRFLTGNRDKIYRLIRENFHLAVQEATHMNHGSDIDFIHSLHFVLVGPDQKIQGYFVSNDPEAMADLKNQLNQLPDRTAS